MAAGREQIVQGREQNSISLAYNYMASGQPNSSVGVRVRSIALLVILLNAQW